jgi:uncharacterized membrane protein YraQ (UPF0718 family)
MLAALVALAGLAYWRGGEPLVRGGLGEGARLLWRYLPIIAVSFLAAGIVQTMIPTEWVRGALGHEAGIRGILIATAAGAVTPAGPFVSMPIAAVLLRSGAGLPAVVAFVTAWSLLAVHRLVSYEVPILGWRFAALRYAVSLVLPVAAGLLVRLFVRS